MFLLYASLEPYWWWNGMLYLCKMRMNLVLRSLKISNLKRLLFTLKKAFMSWKAESVCVKMLFLWEISRRISSESAEWINFWTQKSIKSWKKCRFSAEMMTKSCFDYDFVLLFEMTLTAWRIELLISWPNIKRLVSERDRRLSLLLFI